MLTVRHTAGYILQPFAYTRLGQTILVSGGAGYIGTALVSRLLHDTDFNVNVLDNLMYGSHSLFPFFNYGNRFKFIKNDMRGMEFEPVLRNVDYVVNLAALVGEPICKKYPEDAVAINYEANLRLAKACEMNGIPVIFSSTCSNYGISEELVDEDGQLIPVSLYAKTKVDSEKRLLTMKKLKVTILRFATAYGLAARVRFDLLLHEFIRDAWTKKIISIRGPEFYRPMAHVDDIARAIVLCIKQQESVGELKHVYNVGATPHNFKKIRLAEMVAKRFDAKIVVQEGIPDPRNYKVSFEKIKREIGFVPNHSPQESIDQIAIALEEGVIDNSMLYESVNVRPGISA